MGNESSALQGCDLDPALDVTLPSGWSMHPAKQDGRRLTVFVNKTTDKSDRGMLENAAKRLKVLRHPCIIKFYDWHHNKEGVYLMTEKLQPLSLMLGSLSADEICAGLFNIIEAISFLHDRCGMSHNNISLSSIYVSSDGSWKLGGMECVSRFENVTSAFLENAKSYREEKSIPPEEKVGKVSSDLKLGHSRDAYAFGMLAEQFLDVLNDLGDKTKTFELRIQDDFLNQDPASRPKLSSLLEDRLFKNEFIEVLRFLKYVTIKSDEEKQKFFRSAVRKLLRLPPDLIATRLVRPMLARFVLLDETADEFLVPHFLTPAKDAERKQFKQGELNPILPTELFKKHVIPELFKIFHVRDAHIRLVLLSCFANYVDMFEEDTLRSLILPQLLFGLRDTNNDIVAASLHALADLVPILGGDVVIGGQRGKVFAEGKPKFSSLSPHGNSNTSLPHDRDRIGNGISPEDKKTLKIIAMEANRERRRDEAKKKKVPTATLR